MGGREGGREGRRGRGGRGGRGGGEMSGECRGRGAVVMLGDRESREECR